MNRHLFDSWTPLRALVFWRFGFCYSFLRFACRILPPLAFCVSDFVMVGVSRFDLQLPKRRQGHMRDLPGVSLHWDDE